MITLEATLYTLPVFDAEEHSLLMTFSKPWKKIGKKKKRSEKHQNFNDFGGFFFLLKNKRTKILRERTRNLDWRGKRKEKIVKGRQIEEEKRNGVPEVRQNEEITTPGEGGGWMRRREEERRRGEKRGQGNGCRVEEEEG